MFEASTGRVHRTAPPAGELLGRIHGINGCQAKIAVLAEALEGQHRALITVGRFVKIDTRKALLVGAITDVFFEQRQDAAGQDFGAIAHVDLMGEIDQFNAEEFHFRRGVKEYPTIGDSVMPLTTVELRAVFHHAGKSTISVGSLHQDDAVDAHIEIDELLNKHFAVLGSTGVGKSSALAHILVAMMRARPALRIFLLDPHNEYDRCFGERAHVVNPANLRLPFWLFNFEEIVDVFFGARPAAQEEIDILAEVIPLAKLGYTKYHSMGDRPGLKKLDTKTIGYTVDTPVPYRLADLVTMIDQRMGKLENRHSRLIYHKLITRIETVSNDPRYGFMFENANVGGDTMAKAISHLFRLPAEGKPITVLQLAGFPVEVVDAVVSVLARLAFDFGLWSDGSDPLLFVCEEAHKYAAADHAAGFTPTRRAISRIAKEGRKYGVHLGLVTQRPAELDPTIISQCGTLIAMRMSNDRDQALLRSAVSDTAANLFAFVPSLGTREALAFGVAIPIPTRLTFAELAPSLIPKSKIAGFKSGAPASEHDLNFISSVVERWRGLALSPSKAKGEPMTETTKDFALEVMPQPDTPGNLGSDPDVSLLTRAIGDFADPRHALRRPIPGVPNR